jgi:hypothetical protein
MAVARDAAELENFLHLGAGDNGRNANKGK